MVNSATKAHFKEGISTSRYIFLWTEFLRKVNVFSSIKIKGKGDGQPATLALSLVAPTKVPITKPHSGKRQY